MSEPSPVTEFAVRVHHVATGEETSFAFPFRVFDAADVHVYVAGARVETGFAVDPAPDGLGGTVVFDEAPAAGAEVALVRRLVIRRGTSFSESAALRAAAIDSEFARQLALIAEAADRAARALVLPDGDAEATLTLPPLAQRRNRYLGFDNDGNAVTTELLAPPDAALASSFVAEAILPAADASVLRTALGLGGGAVVDTGTDAADVPTNADLGSAAYKESGAMAGDVPVLDVNGLLDEAVVPRSYASGDIEAPGFHATGEGEGTGFVDAAGDDLADRLYGGVATPRDLGEEGSGNAQYYEYTLEEAGPGQIRLAYKRILYTADPDGSPPQTCVPAGTPVLMADGTWTPIERVALGERVAGLFGFDNEVLALDRTVLGRRPLWLVNGAFFVTAEHLMWTGAGWAAISKRAAMEERGRPIAVTVEGGRTERRPFAGVDPATVTELRHGSALAWRDDVIGVDSLLPYLFAPDTPLYTLVLGGSHTMIVAGGYVLSGWARDDDFDYARGAARRPTAIAAGA